VTAGANTPRIRLAFLTKIWKAFFSPHFLTINQALANDRQYHVANALVHDLSGANVL
jgi:hypothetical protein